MKNVLSKMFATWFWSGLIPPPSFAGIYGMLASLPLCYLLVSSHSQWFYWGTTALIIFVGRLSIPRTEVILGPRNGWAKEVKKNDQIQITIDETAGLLITSYPLLFHELQLWYLGLVFIIFFIFDISKIPPANFFHKKKTAWSVMTDDICAGIYAACTVQIILSYFKL